MQEVSLDQVPSARHVINGLSCISYPSLQLTEATEPYVVGRPVKSTLPFSIVWEVLQSGKVRGLTK